MWDNLYNKLLDQWISYFKPTAERSYRLRLYINGNRVPKLNISELDVQDHITVTPGDVSGILLNMGDDSNACNDVGFDNFGMWNKTLNHEEILKIQSGDFCDSESSK